MTEEMTGSVCFQGLEYSEENGKECSYNIHIFLYAFSEYLFFYLSIFLSIVFSLYLYICLHFVYLYLFLYRLTHPFNAQTYTLACLLSAFVRARVHGRSRNRFPQSYNSLNNGRITS